MRGRAAPPHPGIYRVPPPPPGASQNMDEEMSKLLAVKIIQTYTQLMKMQSETESQSSSSLSITVRRFISFWTIPC